MSKKLSLLLILTLLSTLTASAQTFINSIYYYLDKKKGEAQVSSVPVGLPRYSGGVSIPEKFEHEGVEYKVTSIMSSAFCGCSDLGTVTIPDGVTEIGKNTFKDCPKLTIVNIPNNVTVINGNAFYGCSSLNPLPNLSGVTLIEGGAFYGCSSLKEANIPGGVTIINGGTFYNCSALEYVNIPNNVTVINGNAFYGCSSLESIEIPINVENIGDHAFAYCSKLKNVFCYPLSPPQASPSTFEKVDLANATLHVPPGYEASYMEVEPWKSFGLIVPIIHGDSNGDGIVDMKDTKTIANARLGTEHATKVADVNKDGVVSMPDIMFTINYIKNGKFPDE